VSLALKRGDVPTRKVELSERQLAEARRLRLDEGWSLNKLGRHFGVDPKTMKRRLAGSSQDLAGQPVQRP
jgi:hypothetical protein